MKVITIESEAYKYMMRKIDRVEMYFRKWQEAQEEKKIKKNPDTAGALLFNDEVADMLEVSLRTLQRLRSNGEITFSIFCGRARYKLDDVQKFIQRQVVKSKYE
jgi:excisionase family DNA binding protein